jgi:peptidoglycan/xylan/chitin deacetylase (PgdA/CDA1 family)
LKEHGFTGTFFVITKTVGRAGQMTWDQLREMAAQGMSIESHTVSHPDLRGVSAARLASELSDSRVSIEKAIGRPSYVLCYPSGAYDARVIAATRAAGYLMAVTTDKGEEGDPHAVYEMKRRRVQPHLPLETFAKRVHSAPGDTGSGSGVSPGVSAAHDCGDDDQAMTAARAREIGANELGRIPVLMFHLIGHGKGYLAPDALRFDIALLRSHGFYPTSIREMVEGTMKIPAGKSPVVLTFDDSSPGQYRILGDGTIDPECAVGILQAEVARGNWAPRATFFPLLTVNPANVLFGQPELAERKLQNLVEWGYEVGSHGMTHMDFSKATAAQVKRELAQSQQRLETLIGGGYEVFSLSPPYGEYPSDRSLLLSGTYEGYAYKYHAVVMAWGESSPSPFSSSFDPTHIPRITAAAPEAVRKLMKYWNGHRQLLYVSDGDSGTISFPEEASAELGTLRAGLAQKVVEY